MIDELFSFLSSAITGNFILAIIASFGWGVTSVLLSPCHLSSIPLIIGFINSQGFISIRRTFNMSLIFASGILITIILVGIITASLGRLIGDVGVYGNYFVAAVFFITGLYLTGIIKLPWENKSLKPSDKKGYAGALILGLLFGIGLGPCTFSFMAPVLGLVFQIAGNQPLYAFVLLLAFGIGHCTVIALAGTFTIKVQEYLNWTESSKTISYLKKTCGLLVIIAGLYLIIAST